MAQIRDIIRQELLKNGPISFHRFMELALYCPNFGYYEHSGMTPGAEGDFFTSVSVGPLFGELLTHRFSQWFETIDSPQCILLECGAHEGRLANDVLNSLSALNPDLFQRLEYWILEPSSRLKERQQKSLESFAGKTRWIKSWSDIPLHSIQGVIFSNELIDAMPVHRFGWNAQDRTWFEWGVDWMEPDFVWHRLQRAVVTPFLQPLPTELMDVLPDGFTTEFCPTSATWWTDAAQRLSKGKLLALDYGLTFPEFFAPQRSEGTLRAYHQHKLEADVLKNPGQQDITAHVNFDALISAGEKVGLKTDEFHSQEKFLTAALQLILKDEDRRSSWTPKDTRQFKTLTHPSMMGRSFRTLVQSR